MQEVWLFLLPIYGHVYNGALFEFVLLVCDVLDVLGLSLAQLVPNAWRILMACCTLWWRVLELMDDEYPDLTALEFLYLMALDTWTETFIVSSHIIK